MTQFRNKGLSILPAVLGFSLLLAFAAPVLSAKRSASPPADDGGLTINFEDVELPVFIKFISKVTGRNFVFSDKVSGTVTVVSPQRVTAEEAFAVFQSVLAVRGLTMIEDGVVTRVVPLKEARAGGSGMTSGDAPAGAFATRLIPLEHVEAEDLVGILTPLVSREGSLVAYAATNTLIATDTVGNLSRVAEVVSSLDIPSHEESAEVIGLEYADAATLATQIADVLTTTRPLRGRLDKEKGGSVLRPTFKIVPDKRTNSLIVIAGKTDRAKIRDLIAGLDTPLQPGEERINVYYAKYAQAKDLVDVVSGMTSGRRRITPAKGDLRTGAAGGAGLALGEPVSITADVATNAVIVNASARDYGTIKSLLESLDIERPQVFVEAIVAEVSVDRSKALGFEFQGGGDLGNGIGLGRTNLANLGAALSNPASLAGLILAATSDRTIQVPDGQGGFVEIPAQVALFQALEQDKDIEVLSAPTVLTLDNEQAKIVVGQNVPFVTSRGVDIANVENVFTTVQRQDVGIKLTITPQVSEGDVVMLEVQEEVSAVVPSEILDENQVGPTTTIRSADTTVSVADGHTAVIGGLISNSLTRRGSKVPILGDIPLLGRLFRADADSGSKVNLIVFLTPHIIRNAGDMGEISKDRADRFRQQVPSRRGLLLGPDFERALPLSRSDAPASSGPKQPFPEWPALNSSSELR